jgi:hypothetical protein
MSNKKETAVEYLTKEFSDILGPLDTKPMQDLLLVDAIKRAKEMEKQQIIDAYERGDKYKFEVPGEQYYNETYER